jgi:hypothetical protein
MNIWLCHSIFAQCFFANFSGIVLVYLCLGAGKSCPSEMEMNSSSRTNGKVCGEASQNKEQESA